MAVTVSPKNEPDALASSSKHSITYTDSFGNIFADSPTILPFVKSARDKSTVDIVSDDFLVEDPHRVVSQVRVIRPHVDAPSIHGSSLGDLPNLPPSMGDHELPQSPDPKQPTPKSKPSSLREKVKLPKTRPSLQSMFVPGFLQSSSSSAANATSPPRTVASRARSQSAVAYPYDYFSYDHSAAPPLPTDDYSTPSFLLDDDPFAAPSVQPIHNTSTPTSASSSASSSTATIVPEPESKPLPRIPRSHLSPTLPSENDATTSQLTVPPDFSTSRYPVLGPAVPRPKSSGNSQARPAHTRPAFSPRPSLPSLHTLASMNVAVPRKVRKGTVGARLPHEPWNIGSRRNIVSGGNDVFESQGVDAAPPGDGIDFTLGLSGEQSITPSPQTLSDHQELHFSDHDSDEGTQVPLPSEDLTQDSVHLYDTSLDSTPSLSYTPSGPSSCTLSRSSIVSGDSSWSAAGDQNSFSLEHEPRPDISSNLEVEGYHSDASDPLGYHSSLDYYTQAFIDSDSVADPRYLSKPRSRSPEVGITPYTSMYSVDKSDSEISPTAQPDVSAGMGQNAVELPVNARYSQPNSAEVDAVPTDGAGRDTRSTHDQYGQSDSYRGGERGGDNEGGENFSRRGEVPGGFGGGRRGDDDGDGEEKNRRYNDRSSFSSPSDYSSSSEEEAGNTEYYSGLEGIASTHPESSHSLVTGSDNGTDDDVPLAQRIPTALKAQRTIRKQVKDEREQRRMERAMKSRGPSTHSSAPPKSAPIIPYRPQSSSQEAALHASQSLRRERTRPKPAAMEPFAPDDLAKKLQSLQSLRTPPATAPLNSKEASSMGFPGWSGDSATRSKSPNLPTYDQLAFLQRPPPPSTPSVETPPERTLRPMRSFHRSGPRKSDPQSGHEGTSSQSIGRSATTGNRRAVDDSSVMRSTESGRVSLDKSGKMIKSSDVARRPTTSGGYASTRTSSEGDLDVPVHRSTQRPPVPPLPPAEVLSALAQQAPAKTQATQQRIFIGGMQRFSMVELLPGTNAGDVVDLIASQGALEGATGWMLWEMAQDFGMERPIRSYELLSDISASWNKDKMVNAFAVKTTPLAPLLSRSAIPTLSPTCRGYVEWESKRGKWSKRWMELREHSLWLSKRDTGKDETFLCSLSNFDAYYVTRRHKAPKPFVFAVKSTDNLTLFEDASDYLHVFSCNQKDGEKWMQAILVARSYVLHQERNVLFTKATGLNVNTKGLSRTATRKQSSASRPTQPLVNVATPSSASATTGLFFEPGSLLAKRKGDVQP